MHHVQCNYCKVVVPEDEAAVMMHRDYVFCLSHATGDIWDNSEMSRIREDCDRARTPPPPVTKNRRPPRPLYPPQAPFFQEPSADTMITVTVGRSLGLAPKSFSIHRFMLTENSVWFARELSRTESNHIELPSVYPIVFGYLNEYLYRQTISDHFPSAATPAEVNGTSSMGLGNLPAARLSATSMLTVNTSAGAAKKHGSEVLPSLPRLVKLWVLADELGLHPLADYAAFRCVQRWDADYYLSSPDLEINFKLTKKGSKQRRFLVDYVVWGGRDLSYLHRYNWPKDMLVEIFKAMVLRFGIESGKFENPNVKTLVAVINTMANSIGDLKFGSDRNEKQAKAGRVDKTVKTEKEDKLEKAEKQLVEMLVEIIKAMAEKMKGYDGEIPENPLMDVTNYYRNGVHSAESYMEAVD